MKILIMADEQPVLESLTSQFNAEEILSSTQITTAITGNMAAKALKNHPDLIVMPATTAIRLNALHLNATTIEYRSHISARTSQGTVIIPVNEIIFFEAEQKYVVAHHASGTLLINDSLNELEDEFNKIFIRIHRKYLVAKNKINKIRQNEKNNWMLELYNNSLQLPISRRRLANLKNHLVSTHTI